MPTGIILYALTIVVTLIVWEVIKAIIKKVVNKEYVEKKDFNEFKIEIIDFQKDCIECRRQFPKEYATKGDIHRLENIHNDDVNEINRTVKGGFESVTKRIDDFLKHT